MKIKSLLTFITLLSLLLYSTQAYSCTTWIHYKMVLNGKQAKLYIGTDENPAFEIHTLILDVESGQLGVKGPADGTAYFANFSVSPDVEVQFDKMAGKPSVAGVVKEWMVSEPITNNLIDQNTCPANESFDKMKWKPVTPDEYGMVNLTRELIRNPMQPGWTYAKTTLTASEDETRRFSLGYSDYVTVFLNGNPIFAGTNAYNSRDPAFAGLIGFFDEVYLPLKRGGNELVLLVGEQFGGWGFMLQDPQITDMDPMLEKRWELAHTLSYPESVAWDPKRSVLYVSWIFGWELQV